MPVALGFTRLEPLAYFSEPSFSSVIASSDVP
jgi:hypothetical protein